MPLTKNNRSDNVQNAYNPDYVVMVSDVIEDFLESTGRTIKDFSEETGIPTTRIYEILKNRHKSLSQEEAEALQKATGISAKIWIGIDNQSKKMARLYGKSGGRNLVRLSEMSEGFMKRKRRETKMNEARESKPKSAKMAWRVYDDEIKSPFKGETKRFLEKMENIGGDIVKLRCSFDELALAYKKAMDEIKTVRKETLATAFLAWGLVASGKGKKGFDVEEFRERFAAEDGGGFSMESIGDATYWADEIFGDIEMAVKKFKNKTEPSQEFRAAWETAMRHVNSRNIQSLALAALLFATTAERAGLSGANYSNHILGLKERMDKRPKNMDQDGQVNESVVLQIRRMRQLAGISEGFLKEGR